MITDIVTTRLAELEEIIERDKAAFIRVGYALLEIKTSGLYKDKYATFEQYLRDRWDIARSTAYQLMDAVQVIENVRNCGQIPANEAQARPLASLPPEQQVQIWQQVVDTAPEGKITAAFVQETVERVTKPHVSNNSGENEWYTPAPYIEAARRVMGRIDTDPASSDLANETVKAGHYYTEEDDGRVQLWTGSVWMNPPYSQPLISQFIDVLIEKYNAGEFDQACVLVNNATETNWYQSMLVFASAVCFIKGRVKFIDKNGNPSGAPLQGQTVLYFGNDVEAFTNAFTNYGIILYGRER